MSRVFRVAQPTLVLLVSCVHPRTHMKLIRIHAKTNAHSHMKACTYTRIHTCIHTHAQRACAHTHVRTHVFSCVFMPCHGPFYSRLRSTFDVLSGTGSARQPRATPAPRINVESSEGGVQSASEKKRPSLLAARRVIELGGPGGAPPLDAGASGFALGGVK